MTGILWCRGCCDPEPPITDHLCNRCRVEIAKRDAAADRLERVERVERVVQRFERLLVGCDVIGIDTFAELWDIAERAEAFIEEKRANAK